MASSVQPNVVVNENLNRTMAKIKCEVEEDFHLYPSNNDRHPAAAALGAYSMKNAPFGNSNEPLDCVVCGDRATGKHYGAISCDGCKGFFRRSVRKNPVYECRHHNNCTIDKDKRNQCRHCRLKKCIRMGMKKEAVQKERDRLGRQRNSHHHHHHHHPHPPHPSPSANSSGPHLTIDLDEEEDDDLSVTTLLKAEKTAQDFIGRQIRLDRQTSPKERLQATLETICISMNYQLRSLIEWAKGLKSFVELTDNDKIALLRGHTSENLILGLACRSLNCDDYLLLGNHYIIPRNTSDPALACMAGRILDEIVKPLKENQVDEKEYACLKAIVFFDNDNKSLSDPVRVKAIRKHIQVNLETYINQQRPLTRGRFGELLLLLPPLQNISRLLVDLVARYNHDSQHVDDLINEMLLNRYLDDREESGMSTTNRSNHNTTTSSPSDSVSKENDLDSNASSIDTDMEDNHGEDVLIATPQYDPLASGAPIPDSVLIGSSNVDADLEDITLNGNDDYLADNLAHIQLLQAPVNGDPHFGNRTGAANEVNGHRSQPSVIHYFADTAASNQLKSSVSKPISTPSPTNSSVGTSFDMNQDMAFLCDLITPPTTSALRSSLSVQSNPNFFDDQWNT